MSFILIPGKVIHNLGVASETLKLQLPLFPTHIREALGDEIHLGTINLKLVTPLIIPVEKYDMDTGGERNQRIKWSDNWVAERFLFKRCRLLMKDTMQPAWIYRSSSTPNSVDPYRIEIITKFVPDLEKEEAIYLGIDGTIRIEAISV